MQAVTEFVKGRPDVHSRCFLLPRTSVNMPILLLQPVADSYNRRKINIWSGAIIVSPYLGPLITAFIINKIKWPVAFWVATALTALCWLLVIAFMDETIYNRLLPREQQPISRFRLLRLLGIEQWQSRHTRMSFAQAIMRPIIAIAKLPVLLCTVYYFLNFAWIIGVNATISIWLTSRYKFTPYNLGFFYFAPICGSIIGAIIGHTGFTTSLVPTTLVAMPARLILKLASLSLGSPQS